MAADREIVLAAVQQNWQALEYADPAMKAVRDAIDQYGWDLKHQHVAVALEFEAQVMEAVGALLSRAQLLQRRAHGGMNGGMQLFHASLFVCSKSFVSGLDNLEQTQDLMAATPEAGARAGRTRAQWMSAVKTKIH